MKERVNDFLLDSFIWKIRRISDLCDKVKVKDIGGKQISKKKKILQTYFKQKYASFKEGSSCIASWSDSSEDGYAPEPCWDELILNLLKPSCFF